VYQKLLSEAKHRDKESREGMKKCARLEASLATKEEELAVRFCIDYYHFVLLSSTFFLKSIR
jgi:hypothetical protein